MSEQLTLPRPISEKLETLDKLVEKYPEVIPTETAADFLGIGAEFLKSSIEHGNYEFALFCHKDKRGYRSFKILSTPFYLWYSKGMRFKQFAG